MLPRGHSLSASVQFAPTIADVMLGQLLASAMQDEEFGKAF